MATRFNELPPMEQLAIEQALYSKLGEQVDTKNPDSLRARMDEELIANYRAFVATGLSSKSSNVFVNGQEVGTYGVRIGKGVPEHTESRLATTNGAALEEYVNSDECAEERAEYMALVARNFAEWMLETYGVVCDGCEVVEETVPEQPPKVTGTTLRIDPEKVGEALRGHLPTTVAGLLGGDTDA